MQRIRTEREGLRLREDEEAMIMTELGRGAARPRSGIGIGWELLKGGLEKALQCVQSLRSMSCNATALLESE
jgi:hypothetical protein